VSRVRRMSWYASVYVVVLTGLGIYSAYDDLKDHVSPAYVAVDALVTMFWLYSFVAYYVPGLALPGVLLLLMLAFGIVWTIGDAYRELRRAVRDRPLSHDAGLSPATNLWVDRGVEAFGVLFGVALAAPAIIAAAVVVERALG
jgi:hypothetical protein